MSHSDKKTAILEKLTTTRHELLDYIQSLSAEQWQAAVFPHDAQAAWTAADLLRHVVDAEYGMTGLMKKIQRTGEGVPSDFDRQRWNQSRVNKAKDKTPVELMADMASNRADLIAFIDSIEPDDWQKKGRHASLRILSIEEICHLIADHEQQHLADMQAALD